ncbi:DUF1919 domain-containing protein [Urechidicola croceus]|uniref:Uncharacterized protein n=1 Tax=Urechidicola croceus TaxID=1850246 RepID=A0A1D8P3Q0_9FLAO|nr:DUF1919 domain-containing protein [Urechidicola croceus]AOW19225.1 hypothetical protein LPB138_00330 [Urechidicola croceus]
MNPFRKIYVYIRRKSRVYFKKFILKKEKKLLKDKNFVIIADNCWGGAVYQWYERPYNSPFAGVGIYGDCYMKLLSNFDHYMAQELQFIDKSKYPFRELTYPLALLGDVELHFTHYKTPKEAGTKWVRRTQRMLEETNKDNYYFKICDAWKADEEIFKKFHQLPFKNKISFTLKEKKTFNNPAHIGVNEHHKDDKTIVPNGIKLFKISFLYYDVTKWIVEKTIKRTTYKG